MTDQPKPQKAVMTERDGHLYIDGDGGIELNTISGAPAPALTPEEWAEGRVVRLHDDGVHIPESTEIGLGAGHVRIGPVDFAPRIDVSAVDCPALIALANHALPDTDARKITRADVEACRKFDFNFGIKSSVSVELGVEECDAIALLARKLVALLPPAE